MVWNPIDPWVLACQFFGDMDLKIKEKNDGMVLLELLKPHESWDQAVSLLMRQREPEWNLGPLAKPTRAWGNPRLHWERFQLDLPTKIQGFDLSNPFFPGLFPFPSLSAAFRRLRAACAALSPQISPGYDCQLNQIFIPFQLSPQHGFIWMFSRMLNFQISAVI